MLFHPPDSIPRAEYITLPSQEKTRARKADRVTERTLYDFPKTRIMLFLSKHQTSNYKLRPNAKIDINPEQMAPFSSFFGTDFVSLRWLHRCLHSPPSSPLSSISSFSLSSSKSSPSPTSSFSSSSSSPSDFVLHRWPHRCLHWGNGPSFLGREGWASATINTISYKGI